MRRVFLAAVAAASLSTVALAQQPHGHSDQGPHGGKMADVVLWNGNPFSVYTRPERVWIDGAQMYDANDPRTRPVSDFELGQPGEGDVK